MLICFILLDMEEIEELVCKFMFFYIGRDLIFLYIFYICILISFLEIYFKEVMCETVIVLAVRS